MREIQALRDEFAILGPANRRNARSEPERRCQCGSLNVRTLLVIEGGPDMTYFRCGDCGQIWIVNANGTLVERPPLPRSRDVH
jgi:hypothetical protein